MDHAKCFDLLHTVLCFSQLVNSGDGENVVFGNFSINDLCALLLDVLLLVLLSFEVFVRVESSQLILLDGFRREQVDCSSLGGLPRETLHDVSGIGGCEVFAPRRHHIILVHRLLKLVCV